MSFFSLLPNGKNTTLVMKAISLRGPGLDVCQAGNRVYIIYMISSSSLTAAAEETGSEINV